MRPAIILAFRDEEGAWREVEVAGRRFTIGSGADNDLVIRTPAVSRRHAVIENHDGGVLAYDCQSQHGTLLNNSPLRGPSTLRSGDLLTLGGACDITVKLHTLSATHARADHPSPAPPHASTPLASTPPAPTDHKTPPTPAARPQRVAASAPRPARNQPPIIFAAALILFILAAGFLLLARRQPTPTTRAGAGGAEPAAKMAEAVADARNVNEAATATGVAPSSVSEEELERAAVRVVQRASGQARPYAFPPEALRDITQQVEEYRRAGRMREALVSMQRDARSVAAAARAAGVEPELVIYAALAQSDGGRDPAATARAMIPQLAQLRETFGGTDPDGSLLILAAYTDGVGSRQSHPLLVTIRRLVKGSPFAERNVWFLRERGGLSNAAYGFVIRTIAAGVIAQDPRPHGVAAEPLVY